MIKRIQGLIDSGLFKKPEINKLGHGTHLKPIKVQKKFPKNVHYNKARLLTQEAEELIKESNDKGFKTHVESLFLYIKAFLEESISMKKTESVYHWKWLSKYIISIISLLRKDQERLVLLFEFILFNVKFHYMYIENSIFIKQLSATKQGDYGGFYYFLKEFGSLHEIFELSIAKEFVVVRMENIENYARNKMFIQ